MRKRIFSSKHRWWRSQGFTLVELAIVTVIIGLILVVVFRGDKLFGRAQSQAVRTAVKELNEAISQFRSQYGYLPGDIPNASSRLPSAILCNPPAPGVATTADGNGNGQIDATELACVNIHLAAAGLIKSTQAITIQTSGSTGTTIRAIGTAASTLVASFPTSTRTLIEIFNVPCDIAMEIDEKMDDGNFSTGTVRASVASCVAGGLNVVPVNDPVPLIAVGL